MRAEGEGTVESTQEKMEGHPFFWKEKESILKNPFVATALVYCGISMIQFRGGETLMFILLGMELTGDAWQEDQLKLKNPFQK